MKRFVIFCWLAAGSVTAFVLFQIKQEVRVLEDEIAGTQRQILHDQEAVHILEAEWSYLNSPARIAELAEKHLQLSPIPAERIIGFADLPLPGEPDAEPQDESEPPSTATLVRAEGVKAPAGQSGVLRP